MRWGIIVEEWGISFRTGDGGGFGAWGQGGRPGGIGQEGSRVGQKGGGQGAKTVRMYVFNRDKPACAEMEVGFGIVVFCTVLICSD